MRKGDRDGRLRDAGSRGGRTVVALRWPEGGGGGGGRRRRRRRNVKGYGGVVEGLAWKRVRSDDGEERGHVILGY